MATNYFDLGLDFQKQPENMSIAEPQTGGFSSDDETEQVIQQIVNEEIPQEPQTMAQEELFKMTDNAIASGDFEGWTDDEVLKSMADSITSDGIKIEGYEPQPTKQEFEQNGDVEEKGFSENFNQGMANIIGGALSEIPKAVKNVGGFFIGKPIDWLLEKAGIDAPSLEEQFKKDGIKQQQDLHKILGVEPDKFTTDLGEFGAEVGLLFVPGGQSKLVSKFPQAVEKINQLGQAIAKLGEKAPKTYNLLKSALVGAKEIGKFGILDKGDITKEDLEIGAGFGVGGQLLGGVIKAGSKYLKKELPEKLIVSGLVNPADLRNASERIAKLTGKDADVSDVSKWLLSKGIQGDKQAVRQGIKQGVETTKNEVKALVKGNKEVYNNKVVTDLQNALTEKLGTFGKMTKTGFKPSAGNEGLADDILELATKPGMTAKEINEARGILGEDLFNKSGDLKEKATKKGWQNVWINSSKFLDETLPGFRNLNKEIEVGLALDKAIAKKEARDLTNQILSYMGFGSVGGGITSYASGQDPATIFKHMIVGGLLGYGGGKFKSALNSTQFKTKLANMLSELSPAEKRAVKEGVITLGIVDKLRKGIGVVETNIKATGQKLKNQALEKGGKLADDLADKVGARSKFIDDSGFKIHYGNKGIKDLTKIDNIDLFYEGMPKGIPEISYELKLLDYPSTKTLKDIFNYPNSKVVSEYGKEYLDLRNMLSKYEKEFIDFNKTGNWEDFYTKLKQLEGVKLDFPQLKDKIDLTILYKKDPNFGRGFTDDLKNADIKIINNLNEKIKKYTISDIFDNKLTKKQIKDIYNLPVAEEVITNWLKKYKNAVEKQGFSIF